MNVNMLELGLPHTLDLLKRADKMGIKIWLDKEDLVVKYPKNKTIDHNFLNELRQNKSAFVDYFKKIGQPGPVLQSLSIDEDASVSNPSCIVPSTYHWWLNDDDLDLKNRLFLINTTKIEGDFNLEAFKQALDFLLQRHESLRATFHRVGHEYRMSVLEATAPVLSLDYRDLTFCDDAMVKDVFYFNDHQFNFEKGPLFLVRLLKTGDKELLMSIKMHHIIYDAWSLEILWRDLFIAYFAFAERRLPDLPKLKFQYRHYMSYLNRLVEKNSENDRTYWKSIYNDLPDELIIPGQKEMPEKSTAKTLKNEIIALPDNISASLFRFAQEYSCSLYIILQAAVRHYLYHLTKQKDILLATLMFGRDYIDGAEDQVGLYSKMTMFRIVLESNETFYTCVQKVIRANDETREHAALSLLDVLIEMLKERDKTTDLLWKIAIYYTDFQGYISKSYAEQRPQYEGVRILPVPGPVKEASSNIDLHLDFLRREDRIDLKVAFATATFDSASIKNFVDGFFLFLKKISGDETRA